MIGHAIGPMGQQFWGFGCFGSLAVSPVRLDCPIGPYIGLIEPDLAAFPCSTMCPAHQHTSYAVRSVLRLATGISVRIALGERKYGPGCQNRVIASLLKGQSQASLADRKTNKNYPQIYM
jgi:hypothetical protein